MALSLAVTPALDALVAGTIMKNDRFISQEGHLKVLETTEHGGLRPASWVEALQLSLVYPGPALLTMGAAAIHGHWDVIKDFHHWDMIAGVFAG